MRYKSIRLKNMSLKNMSLKRSIFVLSVCCVAVSLVLVGVVFYICKDIQRRYIGTVMEMEMEEESGRYRHAEGEEPVRYELALELTLEQQRIPWVLDGIWMLACIVLPVTGLGIAGLLFYRIKLKTPIAALKEGMECIQKKDLDFSVAVESEDELGDLCQAFETMRAELLRTNQELWEQAEERKRLNAAFSHDLRNPVTILKGTVKLLKQGKEDEHALDRLEGYTLRIENYIETMSGIQRLEQMPVRPDEYAYTQLREEIEDTVRLLAPTLSCTVSLPENENKAEGKVHLDHGIFLNVLENLTGNAARFAKSRLRVSLKEEKEFAVLSVWDDGPGYPIELIQSGPKPFGKMKEEAAHFGMGLYSSQLMCRKHGGRLRLENPAEGGALAEAFFQV